MEKKKKDDSVSTTIRLPRVLHEELKKKAKEELRSFNAQLVYDLQKTTKIKSSETT